ncbi:hypothetical protein EMCRGX_G011482 [Ephydatia muelleri]
MSHNRLLDPIVILPGPQHGDLGIGWAMRAMGIDSNALLYGDLEVGQWEVELGEGITISQAAALETSRRAAQKGFLPGNHHSHSVALLSYTYVWLQISIALSWDTASNWVY